MLAEVERRRLVRNRISQCFCLFTDKVLLFERTTKEHQLNLFAVERRATMGHVLLAAVRPSADNEHVIDVPQGCRTCVRLPDTFSALLEDNAMKRKRQKSRPPEETGNGSLQMRKKMISFLVCASSRAGDEKADDLSSASDRLCRSFGEWRARRANNFSFSLADSAGRQ